MQTIHYNISDKKALSTPDKPVLVAGESGTSEIVLSTVPVAWEGFEVRALLTTPARILVDAFAVGNGFLLTNTMLDAQGYLYVEFVAYRGGTEIDRSLPDKLYVNAGRKELGDIDPAPLPDLVAEMVAAKGDCDDAADAAVLATERIETTDAEVKAAEAIRETNEQARVSAESSRVTAESARALLGAYNASHAYVIGNKVTYLGSTYQCILASTGNLPTNATYWILIAQIGDAGTITAGSTNTAMTGLIAGNGTKISAPTAAQVGALPIPDAGGYFTTDTVDGALQSAGARLGQITTKYDYKDTLSYYKNGQDFEQNGFIDTNGNVGNTSDTNWHNTDFIAVQSGKRIEAHLVAVEGVVCTIAYYDVNKTFLPGVSITANASGAYTVPGNAFFVRFCMMSAYVDNYAKIFGNLVPVLRTSVIGIGDSYGSQNSDTDITKFYWEYLRDALGLTQGVNFWNKYASGHGFGSGGYLENLIEVTNSLTASDTEMVTDILVCGGWNDSNTAEVYGTDEAFWTGVNNFNNYITVNYPNAKVTIGFISWGKYLGQPLYDAMDLAIDRYIKACNTMGWRYLSNAEYIMQNRDSDIWQTDDLHPNNKGQKVIGEELVATFLAGSYDMHRMLKSFFRT